MILKPLVLVTLLFSLVSADLWYLGKPFLVYGGCSKYIFKTVTYSTKYQDYRQFCTNINALATLVGCYSFLGLGDSDSLEFIAAQCKEKYNNELISQNMTEAAKYLQKNGISLEKHFEITGGKYHKAATYPVLLQEETARRFVAGELRYDKVYTDSTYYGIAAAAYWLMVCLLGTVANWTMILAPSLRNGLNGPISKAWRKNVTLPALVRMKRVQAQKFGLLYFLIPSRLETIVVFLFGCLLIGFSAAGITNYKSNILYPLDRITLLEYIAVRSSHLCIHLVPVLILFGGRNNFLIWLTRWKFSTFVTYHRWIARYVVMLALVHGCSHSTMFTLQHVYSEAIAKTFITYGLVSLTAGCLILFQGLLSIRRKWYEAFLVLHIVLALVFVISAWNHVSKIGYANVLYASFAIWGLDRIVRLARVLVFGFPKAEVSLVGDNIKVVIPKASHWSPPPGGFAWLYFENKLWFWQSHPFSCLHDEKTVTFYCKVQSGITLKLQRQVEKSSTKSIQIQVGIEGPYGHSNPVNHHNDVTFLAGGSGFAGIFCEYKETIARRSTKSTQHVRFNWIVKDFALFRGLYKHLEDVRSEHLDITVYITRPLASEVDDLSNASQSNYKREKYLTCSLKKEVPVSSNEFPGINFVLRRPNFEDLVRNNIEEAGKSIAFVCCGPPKMVDEIRFQVIKNIEKTKKRVDFYDTLEIWA